MLRAIVAIVVVALVAWLSMRTESSEPAADRASSSSTLGPTRPTVEGSTEALADAGSVTLVDRLPLDARRATFNMLAPGAYRLRASAGERASEEQLVVVRAGADVEVDLVLRGDER